MPKAPYAERTNAGFPARGGQTLAGSAASHYLDGDSSGSSSPVNTNGTIRRPLRVLLLAEACNPTWPSEPLMGYNMASALAERDDLELTVVTQVRNRPGLEGTALAHRAEFCFVNNELVAKPLFHLARLARFGTSVSWTINAALAWPSYVVFEWLTYRRLRDRLRNHAWDLVHRLTPISPGMAGPLASRIDLPMLLGPLNGGLPWPAEHLERRAEEREWLSVWRRFSTHLPYHRSTYAKAAGVISGSRYTASQIPGYFRGRGFFMPENGVDPRRFPLATDWPQPNGRFRFITVSRLVPVKAVDLVIEAIQDSPTLRSCLLRIVGEGPERPRLEALVAKHKLEGSVEFLGWLDQTQVAKELAASQAFVFPSIKDFGGGAVFEAMSAGLPAIVVDYGGPGDIVTPETGIRLARKPRTELTADLRSAMERLCRDQPLCREQGRAAAALIREEHTWEVKASRMVEIYLSLVN